VTAGPAFARGGSLPRANAAAALVGFGCMAGELTAVRVLAPHFGDSAYVWTNVIGVILASLAGGAWLGGRLAGRADAQRWPGRLLLTAGLAFAAVPLLARPLGGWLVPAGLPLDAAMPALVRGSFVATCVLFAPAMVVLGAVTPLLVTLLVQAGTAVGRAAGGLSAAGTAGSLVGTFAATHWLVPTFGCRATMVVVAGSFAVAACLVWGRGSRRAAPPLVMLVAVASLLGHGGPLRWAAPGAALVAERETRQQYLQVQDDAAGHRRLVVNEGLDSFHSVLVPGSTFTAGGYYDWHALAPLLLAAPVARERLRVLSIGDAAGSLRAVYAGVHPGAGVDAVDIDGECMALGDEFFVVPKASGRRFTLDGRACLALARDRWHVIHVDAYAHQVYVPAHLASREFFGAVAERLEPGGVVACNVGGLRADDPVLAAIAGTLAAEFGHALALHVPRSRNVLLVARRGSRPDPAAMDAALLRSDLRSADADAWRQIIAHAVRPEAWWDYAPAPAPLVDDRPELDELLHRSYVLVDDPAALVPCVGDVDPAGAEAATYAAAMAGRHQEVLRLVATSRDATAWLRETAGDARWSLRHLHSARLEYDAARALADDPDRRARIERKSVEVATELVPIELAAASARRSAAWMVGCCVVGVAGVWWLGRRARSGA
jgi:hypothetical protein